MSQNNRITAHDRLEEASNSSKNETYLLRLYVSGHTSRSVRSIENLKQFCEDHLKGRYEIEIIDVYQRPERLKDEQIIAV